MTAQETQGDPTIRRLCRLGGVSRAGYYRHFDAHAPARADADLRDAIQRLSLAHRHYGYRRITAQLRREGRIANHKRVLRLMRHDNLLCLRRKSWQTCGFSAHRLSNLHQNLQKSTKSHTIVV